MTNEELQKLVDGLTANAATLKAKGELAYAAGLMDACGRIAQYLPEPVAAVAPKPAPVVVEAPAPIPVVAPEPYRTPDGS